MSLIVDKYRVDVVMELCTKYGVREGKVSSNVCVCVWVGVCVCVCVWVYGCAYVH